MRKKKTPFHRGLVSIFQVLCGLVACLVAVSVAAVIAAWTFAAIRYLLTTH